MRIKVQYLRPVEPITKLETGDWIDLRSGETKHLHRGDYYAMPLGVAIELPKGTYALVAPRSSLFNYYGVLCANSFGVIDNSYCGDNDEWHFLIYATRDVYIPMNTRICQFKVMECVESIEIETVQTLGNPDRGGLGSTGLK